MLTHLLRILKYGTSYAIATGFFPKKTAKDVIKLYSFVRIPDNIVDDVTPDTPLDIHYRDAKIQLENLRDERIQSYTNKKLSHPTRGQYIHLFTNYNIPFQYSLDFFKAMIDDCTIHRYHNYEQLEGYMYGSASVVGLMMCYIVGYQDEESLEIAKPYAIELGNAMQLTNFLRDIREDYVDIGRIYIPEQILRKHNLSHEDIIRYSTQGYVDAENKKARSDTMKELIDECRTMYTHSLDGLIYLHPDGQKAIRLAARLYESILDKIERNNYDVFAKSCRTNFLDKSQTLYRYNKSQ